MTARDGLFLPGTWIQTAWDSTSLGALKQCPRLYQYTIIEGWQPKDESIHLRFGQEYHQAIYDFEMAKAAGADFDEALRMTVQALLIRIHDWDPDPTLKAYPNKNRDSLVHLVVCYCDEYRNDPFQTLILENGRPAVELSFNFPVFEIEGEQISLSGHLDEVVEAEGQYWVRDDKTTKGPLNAQYFSNYSPNPQMTLYTIAGKVILDAPVRGVLVKAAQIGVNFTRFVTQQIPRPAPVLAEWLTDTKLTIELARQYAEAQYWPMNDTSCSRFGGCPYQKVCNLSPSHRQAWLEQDFEHREWNPLKARGDV